MRVELHDQFNHPISLPVSRVVVFDDYDNPIAVVLRVEGNHYVAVTAAHKSFKKVLEAMGIRKALVVEKIDVSQLQPML